MVFLNLRLFSILRKNRNGMKYKTQYRVCPLCSCDEGEIFVTLNQINISVCNSCNMAFSDCSEIDVINANKHNNESFYTYLKNEPIFTKVYFDSIIRKIKKKLKNQTIKLLEFGCGDGRFLLQAQNQGIQSFGIDFSPYSEIAKKKFNLNIDVNILDNSNFLNQKFNIIVSHATFEHLYDPKSILQKLVSMLEPDGLLLIFGIPNFYSLNIQLFRNFHYNSPPGHINYFTTETLKNIGQTMNLKKIKSKTYGFDLSYYIFKLKNLNQLFRHKLIEPTDMADNYKLIQIYQQKRYNLFHRIITFIYTNVRIYKTGQSLEIWFANTS